MGGRQEVGQNIRRGADAAALGQELLREATGGSNEEEIYQLALGRPRLGTQSGPSPELRIRIPAELKALLEARALETGQTISAVARAAMESGLKKLA